MFEIREGIKCINGMEVDTFERDVTEGNSLLNVEVGTTGYCGGGRESGGRTFLRLTNICGDFYARVYKNEDRKPCAVDIIFCGDDGLTGMIRALDFAREALNDQIRGINE